MAELPANYDEQVCAALLGKVIGVQYGGPIESWTDDRIWETCVELTGYVRHYHCFRSDNDPGMAERLCWPGHQGRVDNVLQCVAASSGVIALEGSEKRCALVGRRHLNEEA